MIKLSHAQLWVHDQDEALAFYTEKLGMEVRADVTLPEMGDFRWLTVGPPGQEDVAITLMAIPGAPVMDAETAEEVRNLMSKGFAGTVFLTTDDVHASYEELKGRGVEFTETPEERPYGIDSGFRDPSGNSFRLTQVTGAGYRPSADFTTSYVAARSRCAHQHLEAAVREPRAVARAGGRRAARASPCCRAAACGRSRSARAPRGAWPRFGSCLPASRRGHVQRAVGEPDVPARPRATGPAAPAASSSSRRRPMSGRTPSCWRTTGQAVP